MTKGRAGGILALLLAQACGAGDTSPPRAPGPTPSGAEPQPVPPPTSPPGPAPPADADAAPSPPAAAAGLAVSFRLDPRLTTSSYLGERWVSPETFTLVVEGPQVIVDARAHAVRAEGTTDVSASWTPADPALLAVSSAEGHQVSIAIRREGRSTLEVAHAAGSRQLTVAAVREAGVWRVDITQ